jgi:glucokinase
MMVVGLDIGGTKIAAGLIDDGGRIVRSRRTPTPSRGGPDALEAASALVHELRAGADVQAVGVGAPGVIDPATGTVVSATDTLARWGGIELRAELERRTRLPVVVDNDVRAAALGEARAGAARGFGTTLVVSVGTGIGGAIVKDGRPRRGGHGTAGEIAHLLAGEHGPIACGCGRPDHIEAVASGRAIAAAQQAGHSDALTHAATVLGRVLGGLACAIDVDAIVVGGGVTQAGGAFLQPLTDAVRVETLPALRELPVLRAALGADASLVGAGLLAADFLTQAPR